MKDSLAAGLAATRRLTVDAARTIDFMGDALRVYATPSIVNDVEHCCRDLLSAHLDAGEDSVGARVEIDHLAPTPLGMTAEITATVATVDGRLVSFDFVAHDAAEPIARGRHIRAVVDVDRLASRITAKKANS